jgi:hypothetical protein
MTVMGRSGAERLRMLAIEAAAVAGQMKDAHCQRIMMDLAITYEQLAAHAETHDLPVVPDADRRMPLANDEAELWRDRANKTRVAAEHLTDSAARQMMLCVANTYDDLAHARQVSSVKDRDT